MNPTAVRCTAALTWALMAVGTAHADQRTATGNAGTITASAQLQFSIGIGKYVLLRVGNADSTQSNVTFTLGVTPTGPGNSLGYAGAVPPTLISSVTMTNPTGAGGALTVQAFTNVNGTTLSCTLSVLAGATPFAVGATAGGVPGSGDIKVASATPGVQHPGPDLASCNGGIASPITALSTQTGTFTYSPSYTGSNLATGTFGNVVTYTAAAP